MTTPIIVPTPPRTKSDTKALQLLGDRYEIRCRLGTGGMAHVYLAWDTRLEREVAIKVLRREYASQPTEVLRFRDEAKLLARVESSHVVPIYDIHFGDELCYIVLRRLTGQTLDVVTARDGTRSSADALRLVGEVLEALMELHRKEVIHRDIKPANIFIGDDDRAILLDLGVSVDQRVIVEGPPRYTAGTPSYMAPEQRATGHVDERTDVYQVGMVLLYCATGIDPRHVQVDYRELVKTVTPKLGAIVTRATATDPEERYQTAVEMRTAVLAASADARSIVIELDSADLIIPLENVKRPRTARFGRIGGLSALLALAVTLWVGTHGVSLVEHTAAATAVKQPVRSAEIAHPPAAHMTVETLPIAAPVQATTPDLPDPIVELEVIVPVSHPATVKRERAPVGTAPTAPKEVIDVAPSRIVSHDVPATAEDFLHAATADRANGAIESAIAGYRQYLRLAAPGQDTSGVRASLIELESGRF